MTKQIKISKQEKMDTINFFFSKRGVYCGNLTLKLIEEAIVKYDINFDLEFVSMKEEEKLKKEQKKREDEEEDERRRLYEISKEQEEEKERLQYEKLPNSIKVICGKKYIEMNYMERLKDDKRRILFNNDLLERSLRIGGKPIINYIDESGNVVINGITIHDIGCYSNIYQIIYKNSFIKDLINEFKVIIKRKKIIKK
jgi:hypothetical protein